MQIIRCDETSKLRGHRNDQNVCSFWNSKWRVLFIYFFFYFTKTWCQHFALLYFSDASSSGVCFPDHEADVFSWDSCMLLPGQVSFNTGLFRCLYFSKFEYFKSFHPNFIYLMQFIFQIVLNLMTLTPRSGDNLDVIFHDLSTNNGNHLLKQIVVTIFLLTAYCFSHGFLSFYPLIIVKDTIRFRKNSGLANLVW